MNSILEVGTNTMAYTCNHVNLTAGCGECEAEARATGRWSVIEDDRRRDGGPIVNGERFAPGYTPEAAAYEQRTRPASAYVYIATVDTGGIAYSGREFIAIGETEKGAEDALVAVIEADGWPEEVEEDDHLTVKYERLRDYFGASVIGPVPVGGGIRSDL